MAHSVECKICGAYETSHDYPDDYPETVGHRYVSSDPKFEKAMWEAEADAAERPAKTGHQVWMLTEHGLIDIGS